MPWLGAGKAPALVGARSKTKHGDQRHNSFQGHNSVQDYNSILQNHRDFHVFPSPGGLETIIGHHEP